MPRTLAEIEKDAIEAALAEHGGNRDLAAEQLGISRSTIFNKLRRYKREKSNAEVPKYAGRTKHRRQR